jgi:type I restriction enzyme S subunit
MKSRSVLADFIENIIPGDWGSGEQNDDFEFKVKCIRGADINDINLGIYEFLPTRYIKKKNAFKCLEEANLVIEISGGSPTQSTGRIAYVRNRQEHIICSNFCKAIKVKDGNNPKFIYYLINYIYNSGVFFNFESKTTGIKNLLFEAAFNNIKAPDIEIISQNKIAELLSKLDSKIELNNRINAELEAMAKTIYDYWFVQFDFPDERGKPYKSSGGKMVWNEELKRKIPEGWDSLTLDQMGNIVGGSTPSREVSSYFTTDGIPWITPKDLSLNSGKKFIKKGEIDVTEQGRNSASLNMLPRGSVLMSSRAPVGYLAIARNEVTTNQGFKSFVPKGKFTTEYLYYAIKNLLPVIENNSSGSTFKEVSGAVLKTIYGIAPKDDIVESYTNNVYAIFDRQEILEEENQQLATLRDWLLPMLMNGQVTVMDEAKA